MEHNDLKLRIKNVLIREIPFLEQPIEYDTPLISSKLIDSFHTMMMVKALEDEFKCRFSAAEISETYLDTIDKISSAIQSKLKALE
jgi:acyl carrier protein